MDCSTAVDNLATKKISVVLPTYNEKEHIVKLIDELRAKIQAPLEIIVVDDQSKDGTPELVEALGYDNVLLIKRRKRGLASAFHRGILESSGDIICWMDADLCMPVDVLLKLIAALENNDIAIGSRYVDGGLDDREPLRVRSSRMINGFARLVLGGSVRDYDSGFVAIRREVFDSVTLIPFGYGEYFMEFVYDAHRAGLRIVEIGYHFRDRSAGSSKSMPNLCSFFRTGFHYGFRILSLKFRFLRGGN